MLVCLVSYPWADRPLDMAKHRNIGLLEGVPQTALDGHFVGTQEDMPLSVPVGFQTVRSRIEGSPYEPHHSHVCRACTHSNQ